MRRVVILDWGTLSTALDPLSFSALGDVSVFQFTPPEVLADRIADADVVITNKARIGREALSGARNLQLIVVLASVVDSIDLDAASDHGVSIEAIPGYATESVAQFTWAMILTMMCRLDHFRESVASGRYASQPLFSLLDDGFPQLLGGTLGIVGLGRIGTRVAEIGENFGCKILYYSTTRVHQSKRFARADISTIMSDSTVISIHAPRTNLTEGLIGFDEFRLVQPGAVLVNTGRGGVLNEDAVVWAIRENRLRAAALDVFSEEPLAVNSPLMSLASEGKILLTPHAAWGGERSQVGLIERAFSVVARFFSDHEHQGSN